jgi:hypothetical protein
MRYLLIAAAVVAAVVGGVLILAASQPDEFRVARSTTIQAPPERVAAEIVDFRRWQAWSPFEGKDPAMMRSFGGAPHGKGATYAWEGNNEVGKGTMEIMEVSPNKIAIKLDFEKPMEGHNTTQFLLVPSGNGTEVTWEMFGPTPFIGKVLHVFMDFDRMVGDDFAAGLAKLKTITEHGKGSAS